MRRRDFASAGGGRRRRRDWELRSALRLRQPMRADRAEAVWGTYLDGHGGSVEAALGELIVALANADILDLER